MEINGILVALGAVCSAIVLVGGAISIVKGWVRPVMAIKDNVEKLTKHIEELEKSNKEMKEAFCVITESLFVLLLHAETGNSTGEIKEQRMKLQQYLSKF